METNWPAGNCKYHDMLETSTVEVFVIIGDRRSWKISPSPSAYHD